MLFDKMPFLHSMQRHGMISNYGQLFDVLAARRRALGLSQADVDERAGFHPGYTAKVETWQGKRGRSLGLMTLPLLLETLGVALILVQLDESDG